MCQFCRRLFDEDDPIELYCGKPFDPACLDKLRDVARRTGGVF
jgi:hypothetical protein